jgi:hypothetical protein
MDTLEIVVMLVAMVSFFAHMLCGFLLGRYLGSHHPTVWMKLRRPGGIVSGAHIDYLSGWLRRGGFRHLADPFLVRWCPLVHKLMRVSQYIFVTALALFFLMVLWATVKKRLG